MSDEAQITDEMVKAGAAAMCCRAKELGCAAQHNGSDFTVCMLSTFIDDARRCLEAALPLNSLARLEAERDAAILERDETNTDLNDRIADLNAERDGLARLAEELDERCANYELRAHFAEAERDRFKAALVKVRSYNVDIHLSRINYRPLDHIQVIDRALASTPPLASDDSGSVEKTGDGAL